MCVWTRLRTRYKWSTRKNFLLSHLTGLTVSSHRSDVIVFHPYPLPSFWSFRRLWGNRQPTGKCSASTSPTTSLYKQSTIDSSRYWSEGCRRRQKAGQQLACASCTIHGKHHGGYQIGSCYNQFSWVKKWKHCFRMGADTKWNREGSQADYQRLQNISCPSTKNTSWYRKICPRYD